jgi:hemerythrin superfamily protein
MAVPPAVWRDVFDHAGSRALTAFALWSRQAVASLLRPAPVREQARNLEAIVRKDMDALTLLKADHEAVEEKFVRFGEFGPRALKSKAALVADVIEALSVHAAIEEQLLYPAIRDRMTDEQARVLEALEEHHVVKWTLSELDGMSPDHERFDPKFTVLMESVRHHVKEEENDLFPKVRKAFTRSELADLGQALAEAKLIAPKKPHPRSPDEPPMNAPASAVTKPLDALRNAGGAAVRRVVGVVSHD